MINWGLALTLAGIGFLGVFIVLSIVALVLWLVGLLLAKATGQKSKGIRKD